MWKIARKRSLIWPEHASYPSYVCHCWFIILFFLRSCMLTSRIVAFVMTFFLSVRNSRQHRIESLSTRMKSNSIGMIGQASHNFGSTDSTLYHQALIAVKLVQLACCNVAATCFIVFCSSCLPMPLLQLPHSCSKSFLMKMICTLHTTGCLHFQESRWKRTSMYQRTWQIFCSWLYCTQ